MKGKMPMRKTVRAAAVLGLILGLMSTPHAALGSGDGKADAGKPKLPGARPVIEAINYASIQAALDAVPEEGGLVRLPPGEFEIDEPLVVSTTRTAVVGAGTATLIRNTNTDGQPALLLQAKEDDGESKPAGKHRLWGNRIADLRIVGNEDSGDGIHARYINELIVDNVTVSEHGGHGIQYYYCYENPRITDSMITYNKRAGIHLDGCHDIVVSDNEFEENDDGLHCFDGFNLTMSGNNLDDHLGDGVVIENTYGSVVAANMIEECQGRAIVLDRDCYGITLSANVIAHNFSGGVDLIDAHGCAVSANTFVLDKDKGVAVGPGSGRISITGNSFSDSYIGEDKTRREGSNRNEEDMNAATGVVLQSTRDIAVTGNVFSGVRPKALVLSGDEPSRRVLFTDNILTNTAAGHDGLSEDSVVGSNIAPED